MSNNRDVRLVQAGIRVPVHSLAIRAWRGWARSGGCVIRFREVCAEGEAAAAVVVAAGSADAARSLHHLLYCACMWATWWASRECLGVGSWMIGADDVGRSFGNSENPGVSGSDSGSGKAFERSVAIIG
jgi:hypothetical protein